MRKLGLSEFATQVDVLARLIDQARLLAEPKTREDYMYRGVVLTVLERLFRPRRVTSAQP